MSNMYEKKKDFTANLKLSGKKKFRRVFDEGYLKNGHAIGINEIYRTPKKDLDPSIKYSVTDTQNSKNYKEFDFGKKDKAREYAKELKSIYEKTPSASKALKLMDKDMSYPDAVKKVMKEDNISRKQIDKELDPFI